MHVDPAILLFVSDGPVLSSLQFSLAIEGFATGEGGGAGIDTSAATALVIDQDYNGDGLATLLAMRAEGCAIPSILLVTNPAAQLRARAAAAGAQLIEKPLLTDELSCAIHAIAAPRKAA